MVLTIASVVLPVPRRAIGLATKRKPAIDLDLPRFRGVRLSLS